MKTFRRREVSGTPKRKKNHESIKTKRVGIFTNSGNIKRKPTKGFEAPKPKELLQPKEITKPKQ
jgi:hypothetical protein